MKIIEYKTATGASAQELDARVNDFIKDGYQPFATPYFAEKTSSFCQAMMKISELQQQKPKLGAV